MSQPSLVLNRYTGCMRYWLAAVLLLFLSEVAAADLAIEVRCREIAFSNATENRDLEAFMSFLDSDARFVGASVLRGPEQIAATWRVFFMEDGPSLKWRPQFVEVLDSGDLALTRGPYRLKSKAPEGQPIEEWGTFNSIWRIDSGGSWRIIFDAGSPAAEPPDEQTRALIDSEYDCSPDRQQQSTSATVPQRGVRDASD